MHPPTTPLPFKKKIKRKEEKLIFACTLTPPPTEPHLQPTVVPHHFPSLSFSHADIRTYFFLLLQLSLLLFYFPQAEISHHRSVFLKEGIFTCTAWLSTKVLRNERSIVISLLALCFDWKWAFLTAESMLLPWIYNYLQLTCEENYTFDLILGV